MIHPKIPLTVGIKTRYKLIAINAKTGKERELSGWSPNVLLTSGRNELANRDWFTHVQLGTDSTVASSGQTALLGFVAGTNTVYDDTWNAAPAAPYYGWRRKRFRFAVGSGLANQNLNEVGIGWSSAGGDTIATRALIVDLDGVQTSATPLPDEIVDVVVEVRYYPPLGDSTGTVVLNGVTYNYTVRAANVTSSTAWGANIGRKIASSAGNNSDWSAFDNDIGTLETSPNGLSVPSDNSLDYTNAYQNNSYQIVFGMTAGPGVADTSGWYVTTGKLCRSIRFKTTAGWYQVQFDSQASPGNGVPKDETFTFTLQAVLGWDEAVV